jgi:sulfofructose kinase
VAQASSVLADPRWVEGAATLFGEARARGIPTVLDGDMADAEVFERLLPLTDHAIFSEPALTAFAGSADDKSLAALARFGCRVVAVTRGESGVSWYEDQRLHRQAAYAVEVVDTTGAGDVFHGAYALAIGAGLEVRAAMAFSAATAAMKCRHAGGRNGIPEINECLAFMRTKP